MANIYSPQPMQSYNQLMTPAFSNGPVGSGSVGLYTGASSMGGY
jgi:hypothetical protein